VNGLDASAASSFVRLKRLLIQHHILLAFTGLNPTVERRLQREVLTPADQEHWRVFSDLDHAMEWFEDQVLQGEAGLQAAVQAQMGAVQAGQERGGLALLFATLGTEAEQVGPAAVDGLLHLMEYLKRHSLEAGEVLIRQGEYQKNLYFLDAGELSVERVGEENIPLRLETSGPGAIVGELSAYLNVPASATVTAVQPSLVYHLSAENLQRLEQEDPQTAAILHRFLLKRTGNRLLNAMATVEALLG
jgi:SulP family sulfate permease